MVQPPQSLHAPPDLGPRYRAVRLIARGGMGVVWEARDLEASERPCAVKLLGPGPAPPEVARRFEREAVLAGRLAGHDGVVAAHASGVARGGQPFLVMDLVPGETLEDLLDQDPPLPRADAVRVVRDVARAVD
ncbi:MAG: serine/threonine protein kinase, partial [Planctomycetota bacterium]|nr:serine/threonine protein kinase [Planctomycetota bacterium]